MVSRIWRVACVLALGVVVVAGPYKWAMVSRISRVGWRREVSADAGWAPYCAAMASRISRRAWLLGIAGGLASPAARWPRWSFGPSVWMAPYPATATAAAA